VSRDRSPHIDAILGRGWERRRYRQLRTTVSLPSAIADMIEERCRATKRGTGTPEATFASVVRDLVGAGLIAVGAARPLMASNLKIRQPCLEKIVSMPLP
jgi:hypothetical protein